jgi:hypothetical protein
LFIGRYALEFSHASLQWRHYCSAFFSFLT